MIHDLHLEGPVVSLVPLEPGHAEGLAAASDAASLAFHTTTIPTTPELAAANIEALRSDGTTRAFAVLGSEDGELRGITSFYDYAARVPRVEIGHTQYARRFWGGATNPHAKLLLLTYAFETWQCERVALRCDAANDRSAGAIRRLGAEPEGVLRSHRRRHDGTVADTAYFSIVRAAWPEVRRSLLERTEPRG